METTIKLQTAVELMAKENVPQVPDLIQKYLDLKTFNKEGDHFKIVKSGKSVDNPGYGMSYFCQLAIEQKIDDAWKEVYSTGMRVIAQALQIKVIIMIWIFMIRQFFRNPSRSLFMALEPVMATSKFTVSKMVRTTGWLSSVNVRDKKL